jgi:hypothetical protein
MRVLPRIVRWGVFLNLKSSDVWKTLQDHWKIYQKKHYNKGDISQDDDSRRHEEECEESNKEDWRMIMEDEEECDGIEDILSDIGREPRTNRQDWIIGAFQGELGKIAMWLKVFVLEHNNVICTCVPRWT